MQAWVVDTNVLLVADLQHQDVSPDCVTACVLRLQGIKQNGLVALDDGFRILGEYQHKMDPNRGKGMGRAFLKWVLQNRGRCLFIPLQEDEERGFSNFPADEDLRHFDPADRKFVAVATACPDRPPILQAADSKWLNWADALQRHGVEVKFLCLADLQRFRERKGGP